MSNISGPIKGGDAFPGVGGGFIVSTHALLTSTYPPASFTNYFAWVATTTGVAFVNRKTSGWYISNGSAWVLADTPENTSSLISVNSTGFTNTTATNAQSVLADYDTAITLGINSNTYKRACRVATTANINISSAPSSIDGVTLASGDRVLVRAQSTASQNGIYVFNGAAQAMTRATDFDSSVEILGAKISVITGTTYAQTNWRCTNTSTVTVGSTSITFAVAYSAVNGVAFTGLTFSADISYISSALSGTYATYTYVDSKTWSYTQIVDFASGVEVYSTGGASRGKIEAIAQNMSM